MGLTEPGAGSDVTALSTRAVKEGDHYILNGSKMFITNGPIADVAVVYARTSPTSERHEGISAFIVEKGTKGFSAGNKLKKMGVRTSYTSALFFEDCVVPAENLLGQEGAGFLMSMQTVEWDRSTLLAPFIGGMAFVLEKSCRYARERQQFGRSIAEFQAIKHKIADIKIFLEAARSLVYRIAWCKDQGRPLESSGSGRGQALHRRLESGPDQSCRQRSMADTVIVTNMMWKGLFVTAAWPRSEAELPRFRK